MKQKKHVIILSALAIYTVASGIYMYKVNNAALEDLLLTWGVMAVLILLLYLLFTKMEKLREQHKLENEMKDPTADENDDDIANPEHK